MSYSTILYEVEDSILTITLNRPEALNAFNNEMLFELIDACDKADADDDVKAIIITGAGRGFCAGADLSGGGNAFDYDSREDKENGLSRDGGGRLTLRLYELNKPIIAAINGPAVGVGITMTLAMDIRLASENAKIGFVFTRRGIAPEAASSFFLPRIVGISRALEWCFSGRIYPISEVMDSGLIRKVCSEQELLVEAYAIAREIVDNTAPVSVALTRQMLWRGLDMNHPMDAHKLDSRVILSRGRSSDAAEGVVSFIEKRPPEFKNQVSKDMPDFYPWWDEPKYF